MPEKAFSRLVLPDRLLGGVEPLLGRPWEWAAAGWVLLLWFYSLGVLIANLSVSFRFGIATEFDAVPEVLAVSAITFVVVGALVRRSAGGGNVLRSALVLLGAWGAALAALAVIGFFVSLGLPSSPLFYAIENISGLFMGATITIWALGEMGALPTVPTTPLQPPADALGAAAARLEAVDLAHFVPPSVSARNETKRSWELSALGWLVAAWVFVLDLLLDVGGGADFRGATTPILLVTPVSVLALGFAIRSRYTSTDRMGRRSLDLATVLGAALGAFLMVVSVINFFGAFGDNGAGKVIGGLLSAAGRAVFAAVVVLWALGEIAYMRREGGPAGGVVATVAGPVTAQPAAADGPSQIGDVATASTVKRDQPASPGQT